MSLVAELVQNPLGNLVRHLLHHLVKDLHLPLLEQLQLLLVPDDLPVVPPSEQFPQAPDEEGED